MSPSNKTPGLVSAENEKMTGQPGKERLTSPAPLGPSDSNVAHPATPVMAGASKEAPKAVKRSATATSGVEKRKKALKRL